MQHQRWVNGLAAAGVMAAVAPFLMARANGPATAGRLGELPVPGFAVRSLPDADFEKLHRAAAPGKERWAEIPWETDLAAARARAAREGRPLLMWIMDGHPLGCT